MQKVMKGASFKIDTLPVSVTLIACISDGSDVYERERGTQRGGGGIKDDEFSFQIIHNENRNRPSDICTV